MFNRLIKMAKSYLGDIGTRIRTTLNTDLTNLNTVKYYIKKPSKVIATKTCVVEDVPTGIVYYDVVANDFDEVGVYMVQAELVFNDASKFLSETRNFEIFQEHK